jgi:hypothetical protein
VRVAPEVHRVDADEPQHLGGARGQAPGFAEAVTSALAAMAPVLPEVKVSALGTEVVVDGCLAEGASLAWNRLVAALP